MDSLETRAQSVSQIDLGEKDPEAEFQLLLAMACYPNVWVKVSELTSVSKSGKFPFRDAYPYVKWVYEAFGPEKNSYSARAIPAKPAPRTTGRRWIGKSRSSKPKCLSSPRRTERKSSGKTRQSSGDLNLRPEILIPSHRNFQVQFFPLPRVFRHPCSIFVPSAQRLAAVSRKKLNRDAGWGGGDRDLEFSRTRHYF